MTETTVIAIGKDAILDTPPMVVLFGRECPEELRDACVVHEFKEKPEGALRPGGNILFDGKKYIIEKVGEVANENFSRLGHITLVFDPAENCLPGSVVLSPVGLPEIKVGSSIVFL